MAFDAGMLCALVNEFQSTVVGGKVDKIYQPEKDEIIIEFRLAGENRKLLISASSNSPRINITSVNKENPTSAPMFCMLLRKHLVGSRFKEITNIGFERIIKIEFDAFDDMGFKTGKYIICEIMGKFSNIILCDANMKIMGAVKTVDFSTSSKRQILPGLTYELPPTQDKFCPIDETQDGFISKMSSRFGASADKTILTLYSGLSPLTCREIVYSATGKTDSDISEANLPKLWDSFSRFISNITSRNFTPTLLTDKNNKPFETSFFPINQYEELLIKSSPSSFSELIDLYFSEKDKFERLRQHSQDIFKLLSTKESHLKRKIDNLKNDLKDCEKMDTYKLYADLITANIYRLKRGDACVLLQNYNEYPPTDVKVELDSKLSPSQNAQRYYKRYNKLKTAKDILLSQLQITENSLSYVYTIFESLTKAENLSDIEQIRTELCTSGLSSKSQISKGAKSVKIAPMEFITSSGYKVYCGKNNMQNDYITTKLAEKLDYWFHVKGCPGSHVLLKCAGLEEPDAADFTEVCEIAAYYSKQKDSSKVEVDYTLAKNVKKPPASNSGFVIYNTNYSAIVTPNGEKIKKMRVN